LTNAVALNGAMFNTATAVGPAVAGITYALFGPAWCFTINGVSFIAVIAALLAMRFQPRTRSDQNNSPFTSLLEGLKYVSHQPIILTLIGLVAATSLFGLSLGTLLPAWSVKILHGDATTNGLLYSARGIGSLIGALAIATLGHVTFRGRVISMGSLFFPIFIALFALVHWLPLSLLLMALLGVASIMVANLSNSMIQSLVPDELRGRVMGVYSTVFMGSMPLGALFLGVIAEHAGEAEAALLSSAAAFCIAGLVWVLVPKMRRLK
jgi:predicted MFS family arabinose efflux permease